MALTLILDPALEQALAREASHELLSVEELAKALLSNAIGQRKTDRKAKSKNQRRVELLRQSRSTELTDAERQELNALQAELDHELAHSDEMILSQLDQMEAEVRVPGRNR